MLDKRSAKILKYLLSKTEEGKYVVVKVADLIADLKLPDSEESRTQIVAAVQLFVDSEYLGCKFFDHDRICCLAMPKGRVWSSQTEASDKTAHNRLLTGVVAFVCGLIGAFLGALLAGFIL